MANHNDRQLERQHDKVRQQYIQFTTGVGSGSAGSKAIFRLDTPIGNQTTLQALCLTPCPAGPVELIKGNDGTWYALSRLAPKETNSQVSQLRRRKPRDQRDRATVELLVTATRFRTAPVGGSLYSASITYYRKQLGKPMEKLWEALLPSISSTDSALSLPSLNTGGYERINDRVSVLQVLQGPPMFTGEPVPQVFYNTVVFVEDTSTGPRISSKKFRLEPSTDPYNPVFWIYDSGLSAQYRDYLLPVPLGYYFYDSDLKIFTRSPKAYRKFPGDIDPSFPNVNIYKGKSYFNGRIHLSWAEVMAGVSTNVYENTGKLDEDPVKTPIMQFSEADLQVMGINLDTQFLVANFERLRYASRWASTYDITHYDSLDPSAIDKTTYSLAFTRQHIYQAEV